MKALNSHENYFFMLGHFATDIGHGAMPIILAYMYQAGRIENYESVALLLMANTILNAIMQPLAGALADSKPRPYLMSLGIFLSFLGVMFLGLIQNQVLLYALVCINGIGASIFHPAGGKMANIFSQQRVGKGMSIFSVGGNAAMAAAPFYFTGFYIIFGLNATLAMCVPGLIMIIIFMMRNKYYLKACQISNLEAKKKNSTQQNTENVKGFVILVITLFLRSSGWFSFFSFLSLYYMHEFGVKDEFATLLNGMVCAVGAIATYFGGTISDRFGFNKLVVCASLSSVPFIAIFAFLDDPILATLVLIPFSALFFLAMSPTVVIGQKLLCNHVGMATGFTIGLSMSFGGLVSPLIGRLGDAYGIHYIMYAVTFFITLSAISTTFIPKISNK